MIPTAILAGLVLGLMLRWWAIPVVAVAWALVVYVTADASVLGGVAIGAANAAVGTAPAVLIRRAIAGTTARGDAP